MRDQGPEVHLPVAQELLALVPRLEHEPAVDSPDRHGLKYDALRKIQSHVRWRNAKKGDFPARPDKLEGVPDTCPAAGHLEHHIDTARFAGVVEEPLLPAILRRVERDVGTEVDRQVALVL